MTDLAPLRPYAIDLDPYAKAPLLGSPRGRMSCVMGEVKTWDPLLKSLLQDESLRVACIGFNPGDLPSRAKEQWSLVSLEQRDVITAMRALLPLMYNEDFDIFLVREDTLGAPFEGSRHKDSYWDDIMPRMAHALRMNPNSACVLFTTGQITPTPVCMRFWCSRRWRTQITDTEVSLNIQKDMLSAAQGYTLYFDEEEGWAVPRGLEV